MLQLVVGNYGMSDDEERVQMGLWAMFASSMLMSVDLRLINRRSKALLLNINVISISQDKLGVPARLVLTVSGFSAHQLLELVDETASLNCTATDQLVVGVFFASHQ